LAAIYTSIRVVTKFLIQLEFIFCKIILYDLFCLCVYYFLINSFIGLDLILVVFNVGTNTSPYYLNTIANSQEFALFKIVFQ